jgi:hypothetical protein
LELTTREGSRTRFGLRGVVSGTAATLLGEGPLGRSGRGSWLVAGRRSYLEWPIDREESTRTAFGFSDALAKLVYDVHPDQQVALSFLGGMSDIDYEEENPAPNEPGSGSNRAAVVNASWRSKFGSALVLRQRAYIVQQGFINKQMSGRVLDRGTNENVVYRADVTRPFAKALLDGGAELGRATMHAGQRTANGQSISASLWQRSGYAHLAWAVTPAVTLSPGIRITSTTLLPERAFSRWLLGEWIFRNSWSLNVATGMSQQLPELDQIRGETGSLNLQPERASYLDVGVEHRLGNSIRWQATAFGRNEHDILRQPETLPRRVAGLLLFPEHERYSNALRGTSRGIELLVDRRSPIGLSGWISYAYGKTRYTDVSRNETFWGDFDQRHSLSLFATYRFSPKTSVGATFRTGSNFPIPAYLDAREGALFAGDARNQLRLPHYARLDLRADRQLVDLGRQLTLFVELLNALNRANMSLANGSIDAATGEAAGFTDTLFRRRASAGIVVEF